MKGTVTFFLLLCFHLLGGYDAAHAVGPNSKTYFLPVHVEKAQPVKSATTAHGCLITKPSGSDEEKEDLFSIEDEDEDEIISRKHIATARFLLDFCCSFLLYHSRSNRSAPPSIYHPASYTASRKYIAQRVLRI